MKGRGAVPVSIPVPVPVPVPVSYDLTSLHTLSNPSYGPFFITQFQSTLLRKQKWHDLDMLLKFVTCSVNSCQPWNCNI